MTRPSEVRKIDDAAPWSSSLHTSSTRKFTSAASLLLTPLMTTQPHEQIVDRHRLGDHGLVDQELHQRLQRLPVGRHAIGPGIATEHLRDLVKLGRQPRQYIAQRPQIAHALVGERLRLTERVEQTG